MVGLETCCLVDGSWAFETSIHGYQSCFCKNDTKRFWLANVGFGQHIQGDLVACMTERYRHIYIHQDTHTYISHMCIHTCMSYTICIIV